MGVSGTKRRVQRARQSPTGQPLGDWLLRLPGRAAFVAIAVVQIGVELAVAAVRDALSLRGQR